MKKIILFITLQLFLSTGISAQNLLSPIWKISFTGTSETNVNQINTADWKDVNLLLSWERQDYFWMDGDGCIVNDFSVPDDLAGSKLILSISLQCDIKSIYINGKFIGGNLPNQFWSNRGAKTEFSLPEGCLLKGKQNRITIFISNLSYTGGISCNHCSITPNGSKLNSEIKIEIPAADHLYFVEDANSFNIKYNAAVKGKIKLSIVNDFHQSFIQKEYDVEKGENNLRFDFNDVITKPGFYECIVIMNDGGYSSDVRWFTLSPEKNRISAQKSFKIYPELGHLNNEAHSVQMQFLKKEMGF